METILLSLVLFWLLFSLFSIYRYHRRILTIQRHFQLLNKKHADSIGIEESARAYSDVLEFYNQHQNALLLAAVHKESASNYWLRTIVICLAFSLPAYVYTLWEAIRDSSRSS